MPHQPNVHSTPAVIEDVVACWQRDHMIRGEGRKAKPVATAKKALRGRKNTVGALVDLAKPVATEHLVTISIRDVAKGLTLVLPDGEVRT